MRAPSGENISEAGRRTDKRHAGDHRKSDNTGKNRGNQERALAAQTRKDRGDRNQRLRPSMAGFQWDDL